MWHLTFSKTRTSPLLLSALVASGLVFAGCDEHVDVVRDHSVQIPKHATWAWQPEAPKDKTDKDKASHDRDVISRDVISDDDRSETISRDPRSDNETLRLAIRTDIEQEMRSKGFKQVSDPGAAQFLADYHFAIRRHTAAEGGGYREGGYRGGYPGFVCGPFGCWASYTWGYWGGPGYGYRDPNYREGTIVFDFVQQSSNKVAFRAVGQKEMNHDSFSTAHIRDAVHRLLRDLKHGKE
jgi:hypothetical protein